MYSIRELERLDFGFSLEVGCWCLDVTFSLDVERWMLDVSTLCPSI